MHQGTVCFASTYEVFARRFDEDCVVFLQSLEKKRAVLREVQDNLAKLQEKFEENTRKKEDLERQVICNNYKAYVSVISYCKVEIICNLRGWFLARIASLLFFFVYFLPVWKSLEIIWKLFQFSISKHWLC